MAEDAALWPDEFHAAAANGHQVIGMAPTVKRSQPTPSVMTRGVSPTSEAASTTRTMIARERRRMQLVTATAELFARMSTRYTQALRDRGSVTRVGAARGTRMVITTDFGDVIAERMLAAHEALAARWFERLV